MHSQRNSSWQKLFLQDITKTQGLRGCQIITEVKSV